MSLLSSPVTDMAMDLWFAGKLGNPALFGGTTTADERRERIRKAIRVLRLADHPIGKRHGNPETYAQCFARLYGEPLIVPNKQTQLNLGEQTC